MLNYEASIISEWLICSIDHVPRQMYHKGIKIRFSIA